MDGLGQAGVNNPAVSAGTSLLDKTMSTPELEHTAPFAISQADFHALLCDKVYLAVHFLLNEMMEWDLEAFIGGALYERTSTRRDYRNWRYERGLVTGLRPVTPRVPRTCKVSPVGCLNAIVAGNPS